MSVLPASASYSVSMITDDVIVELVHGGGPVSFFVSSPITTQEPFETFMLS